MFQLAHGPTGRDGPQSGWRYRQGSVPLWRRSAVYIGVHGRTGVPCGADEGRSLREAPELFLGQLPERFPGQSVDDLAAALRSPGASLIHRGSMRRSRTRGHKAALPRDQTLCGAV